jgi:polysaccharide export outer membrane protein
VIEILIFEVEELSKPAVLAPDGTVHLPLIGDVELAGLTTRQAAERLRERYAQDLIRDPQIAISVREYHSQPVAVLGAVVRPGLYQLRGPRPLSDVLALAEGLAPDAGSEITIARGSQTFTIETHRLLEGNPRIEPHDTVRVAKAAFIYVVGEVGRAGGFPLRAQQPVSLLQALSLAEGLRRTASAQRAKIIRRAGGSREEIPVRLGDVLAGRAPDLSLQPGDILFIPHSRAKGAALRAAEAAVQAATGVIIWRR